LKALTELLFPAGHPNSFLLTVGLCFFWSGGAAVVVAILARFAWRRGKKIGEL
jgi:hypothetical protein